MRKLLSLFTALLFVGNMWGAVVSGTTYSTPSATGVPSGWTASDGGGTSYVKLTASTNYIQTDEFCVSSFSSITVKARKFGGPTDAQALITVSWWEGTTETVLGTIAPSNNSLTNYTISNPASITENTLGYIKISCKGAGSSKGSGVSEVTITYTAGDCGSSCSNTVTITKGAETNGTYTLSATEICGDDEGEDVTISNITPAAGYAFDEITTSASGTVDNVNKKVTGITANTTITVKFKELQKYTVTWNVNGDESTTTQVYEGSKPVFPATPSSCDAASTIFVGWATAPWTGKLENLTGKTVYTSASDMLAVTEAVTYYAVFAKENSPESWTLTAITDLTASDIFVFADASNYALNNDNGTSSAPDANAITVSEGKVTSEVTNDLKWNISGNATDGYTFYPNGSTTTWLYCNTTSASGNNNNMRVGTGGRKVFEVNASGYLVTKDTYTDRYLCRYNAQDFRGYTSASPNPVQPKLYKYTAGSYEDYMTTCCTKYNVNIAAGITNGSVSADPTSACEGTTITITFSPDPSYHLDAWTVNDVAQDVNDNTFSMPAEDVTVSATFAHDPCTNLVAPTLNGAVAVTYNSATIAWNEVTDAEEYAVSVVNHATSESVFAGNVDALSKALADLLPETQYDYSIMAVGDGTVKCADGNGVLEGNFTTNALPTAHLTLIDLEGTHASSGDYPILTPFNLPTTAASCSSKDFYGWTATENYSSASVAPEYAAGAEFTFANTTGVTLYAVYATVGEDKETITPSAVTGEGDPYAITIDKAGYTLSANKNAGSTAPAWNETGADVRIYAKGDVTLSATTKTMKKIVFNLSAQGLKRLAPITASTGTITTQSAGDETVIWTGSASTVTFTVGNNADYGSDGSSKAGQLCFSDIDVTVLGEYSNYSTTCAAAPVVVVNPEEINATAAAVAAGVIEALYENVNEENISVALFNNQACTEAFDGGWLTASINGDKYIAYTIAENTSYNDARNAYIKLTAPETSGATDPAVVVIPVSQAKKPAVFASLEALVAADVNANTNVTVSFSNVVIKEMYEYNDKVCGVVFDIQKAEQDIKIYFNNQETISGWVAGGTLSGTLTDCPWKTFNTAWQLAPTSGWAWANLTYEAPSGTALEDVETSVKAVKVLRDGQIFILRGDKTFNAQGQLVK